MLDQISTLDEIQDALISEKKGNVEESKISVETDGVLSLSTGRDRMVAMISKSDIHSAKLSGLTDSGLANYDANFTLEMTGTGSIDYCEIIWQGLRTPYSLSQSSYSEYVDLDAPDQDYDQEITYDFTDATNNEAYYTTQGNLVPVSYTHLRAHET